MNASGPGTRSVKFEKAISYILITGLVVSLILEIAGIVAFHHSQGDLKISERREIFIHGKNFFDFVTRLLGEDQGRKSGILLMSLGITILILTPYVRVVLSVFYFLWGKDIKYTLITAFVLALLTLSLIKV